jgi:hypothetical protein
MFQSGLWQPEASSEREDLLATFLAAPWLLAANAYVVHFFVVHGDVVQGLVNFLHGILTIDYFGLMLIFPQTCMLQWLHLKGSYLLGFLGNSPGFQDS